MKQMTLQQLYEACTCSADAKDGEAPACEACFIRSAIEAGIPHSVVFGEQKLSDLFSAEYIEAQTFPKGRPV